MSRDGLDKASNTRFVDDQSQTTNLKPPALPVVVAFPLDLGHQDVSCQQRMKSLPFALHDPMVLPPVVHNGGARSSRAGMILIAVSRNALQLPLTIEGTIA